MKKKRLFLVAAGSGGHILPALVLAQQWLKNNPAGKTWFFTSSRQLDQQLIAYSSIAHHPVTMKLDTLNLRKWWKIPIIGTQLACNFITSLWYLARFKPEKIICTGGMIGLPLCIAGRLFGVTIEVYELNAIPGKAVKALIPFAHKICTPFTQAAQHCSVLGKSFAHKCTVVPYPSRFSKIDQNIDSERVFEAINKTLGKKLFSPSKKTLLIVGGSQGSVFLNKSIQQILELNPVLAQTLQIIHQTGNAQQASCLAWYQKHNVSAYVFDFDPEINWYYQIADLVICRAGAGTLFELAHFGKKSIVIPLVASTTSHQKDNALAIAAQYPKLFTILEQLDLEITPQILTQNLLSHFQQ